MTSGIFKQHKIKHKRTFTAEDTTEKKTADKEKRKTENARKAQVIAQRTVQLLDLENPRTAANPVAASAAVVIARALNVQPSLSRHGSYSLSSSSSSSTDGLKSQLGPSDEAIRAVAAAYGATDRAQVSRENECDEFDEAVEEEEEVVDDEGMTDLEIHHPENDGLHTETEGS